MPQGGQTHHPKKDPMMIKGTQDDEEAFAPLYLSPGEEQVSRNLSTGYQRALSWTPSPSPSPTLFILGVMPGR